MYVYSLKHRARNLNQRSGVGGSSPLPPPARTEEARGRGGPSSASDIEPTTKPTNQADDLDTWVRFAEETFSSPSKEERGEKVSLFGSEDGGYPESSPARGVIGSITLDPTITTGSHDHEESHPARRMRGRNAPACPDAVLNLINTSQLTKTVLKKYSAKCVISGDHVDTYEYHKARTGAKPGKHTGTGEPRKTTARLDNIWRAMGQVKKLINANVGRHCEGNRRDKFLSLTFAENITDVQQANRYFDNFFKKLRYHYGDFKYIAVPQIQWKRFEKYGVKVWHYHVAAFGLPYIPQKELVERWGLGTVSIEAVEGYENPGGYMARYMIKDFTGEELIGHRRFFTSRGLYRPEETRAESMDELLKKLNIPEECKTYEVTYINNPYVGEVTYRHYDLRKGGNNRLRE